LFLFNLRQRADRIFSVLIDVFKALASFALRASHERRLCLAAVAGLTNVADSDGRLLVLRHNGRLHEAVNILDTLLLRACQVVVDDVVLQIADLKLTVVLQHNLLSLGVL
jgi:signal transduction histidine kinase